MPFFVNVKTGFCYYIYHITVGEKNLILLSAENISKSTSAKVHEPHTNCLKCFPWCYYTITRQAIPMARSYQYQWPILHTSQTRSFHNNLPYLPPYFGYPDWESVTLCKYQHFPTLDTYLSLSFSDQKRFSAFQPFNTALFKTNFNWCFFLN